MKTILYPCLTFTASLPFLFLSSGNKEEKKPEKNILFICVDDLLASLPLYGDSPILTPNMERFAGQSVLFDSHYCSVPFSGPSRASMWTGLYPTPERFTNFARAQDLVPKVTVLPQFFKDHGYRTISLGKVFHHGDDFADAWDVLDKERNYFGYQDSANIRQQQIDQEIARQNIAGLDFDDLSALPRDFQAPQGPAFECVDVPDEAYPDGQNTLRAIAELEKSKASGEPFFLAIGYYRPHAPFMAPKKYWDLYDPKAVGLTDNPDFPATAPVEARQATEELYMTLSGIPHYDSIPDSLAIRMRQGYYAGVSYTDALIGKLMDAMDRLGLRENTIVVLWGDNGYLLGEHQEWSKLSNFYEALHVPFLVSAPGIQGGTRSSSLTGSVDIYPTLCELAGLEPPSHAQGISMVPELKNPQATTHPAVFSRMDKGISVRTPRYLYTEWAQSDSTKPKACMLYDMVADPEERVNIALLPENKEIVAEMVRLIEEHEAAIARQDSQHDYGEPNPDMSTNPFN